jgi:putative tricarboxylic transport membrane protein
MSNGPKSSSPQPGWRGWVRNPQDFYGGLALVALALFAFWASSNLPGMRGFAFGPRTTPRLFAGLLLVTGAAVTLIGFLTEGAPLERYHVRGPLFVCAAILFFAASVRPLGLVISSYITIMISAGATEDTRWLETGIWGAILTTFCALLFPYALNLPLPLWPQFVISGGPWLN